MIKNDGDKSYSFDAGRWYFRFGIWYFLSPYLNHKLNLKYNRKDIFFKKKLDYFEGIAKNLEENIKMYKRHMGGLQETKTLKEIKKTFEKLKEERKKFYILASPLYFNTKRLADRIQIFIKLEKQIFSDFKGMVENKKIRDATIGELQEILDKLRISGSEVMNEMKKEIDREI